VTLRGNAHNKNTSKTLCESDIDFIASYEERVLDRKYGEEYLRYRKTSGKWLPNFRSIRTKA